MILECPDNSLSGAISSCLAGGYSFQILTMTPTALLPLPPLSRLPHLNHRGPNIESTYHSNLANILSWSNAHYFILYGGLLWCLTLCYSNILTFQDLVAAALNRPLIATSLVEPGLYDNDISDEDIATLLGTATNNSTLWPLADVFYSSN